ncbi:MAG: RNA methyltransferase [Salegentibacter sp.]|uniref:RNA methyltransferase, TrmH family n=1 Tax=Salegentibacter flavus TaxID=287099 RepID=A0A1I5BX25_9FLAO|nr:MULTISPECIES: RNA methyltransferase [Salegentibacter]MDR9457825.1 RNA methyltransferase [Salegentibacter sp.]SFN78911.1 RNA methyltransferase, TrmH family [Salegentibacter flavus]
MYKQISSSQNKEIKHLHQLQEKSRLRRKEGVFLVEGVRETGLAIKGGFKLKNIFFCEELFSVEKLEDLISDLNEKPEITELSSEVYEKLAYRGSTEGLLALFESRENSLSELKIQSENPLILVTEAPEKPGNIGALLRTADAAGLDGVIIANPKTDLFNPNIIRSSVGCVFTTPIATGSTEEIIDFLKQKNIKIYAAALQASKEYTKVDYAGSSAIVVGTEATGLGDSWLENSEENIIIPMGGEIDSMNVSVAAGILIFEAKRQRSLQQ